MVKICKKILSFVLFIIAIELFLQCVYLFSNSKRISPNMAALRILCIGDSFTYGWGAEKNNNYPSQLKNMLTANNPGQSFQIINAGAFGVSSSIIANNISWYLHKYNPDVVIVLAGANDHWNMKDSNVLKIGRYSARDKLLIRARRFLYNFKIFRIVDLIYFSIAQCVSGENNGLYSHETIRFNTINDTAILQELIRFNLRQIAETVYSYNNGTKLFFQTYPDLPYVNEVIRNIDDYGVIIIDQESIFHNLPGYSNLLASDGWHLNAYGYNFMAESVYRRLLATDIVKNKLTQRYFPERIETDKDEVHKLDDEWEFNLAKIARHPDKLITANSQEWYFFTNNLVDLPEVELSGGEYLLQITARGTIADGSYPLVGFYTYDKDKRKLINKVNVNYDYNIYSSGRVKVKDPAKIVFCISFENDLCYTREGVTNDRNLWIKSVIVRKMGYAHE